MENSEKLEKLIVAQGLKNGILFGPGCEFWIDDSQRGFLGTHLEDDDLGPLDAYFQNYNSACLHDSKLNDWTNACPPPPRSEDKKAYATCVKSYLHQLGSYAMGACGWTMVWRGFVYRCGEQSLNWTGSKLLGKLGWADDAKILHIVDGQFDTITDWSELQATAVVEVPDRAAELLNTYFPGCEVPEEAPKVEEVKAPEPPSLPEAPVAPKVEAPLPPPVPATPAVEAAVPAEAKAKGWWGRLNDWCKLTLVRLRCLTLA